MTVAALSAPEGRVRTVVRLRHVPQSTLTELGCRMRRARLRCGYSQTDAAALLNVSKQTVSNWEVGESPPQITNLFRFAAVMDIDVAELTTGLSDDLAVTDLSRRRRDAASRLVPLYRDIDAAGDLLMHTDTHTAPERYIAPLNRVADEAFAFVVTGNAMAPRYVEGDVVVVTPCTMAPRGRIVVAFASGKYVFRRFLPKVEGKVEGAVLRALNADHLDIEMGKGDAVLGTVAESISHRQE